MERPACVGNDKWLVDNFGDLFIFRWMNGNK